MIRNHFDYVPQVVGKKRSVFPYWQSVSGSYELGRLYPLDVIEISPGQSLNLDIAGLIRSGTLVNPLMDDIIVDLSAFYVRNRISWNHWEQFLGSNDEVAFVNTTQYTKPYIDYYGTNKQGTDPTVMYSPAWRASSNDEFRDYCNTLACHFGLPVSHYDQEVDSQSGLRAYKMDALWVRGYYRIWNEFWRDENTMNPVLFSLGDVGNSGQGIGPDGITPVPVYTTNVVPGRLNVNWQLGYCAKVRKLDDYFTSCLPSPVRATAAPSIPVDSISANVLSASSTHAMGNPVKFVSGVGTGYLGVKDGNGFVVADTTLSPASNSYITNTNLYVDLANTSTIAISKLRDAVLLNRLYENRLRVGGRYPELLQGEFGVHAALDDRAQLLIHKRFNINISEVVSTAQTDDSSGNTVNAVGELGGMSKTPIRGSLFTASFDEHGLVYILMCIRQRKHTYIQGFAKKFYRETWLDYYWPSLNGTSDVAVLKKELYASFDPNLTYGDDAFGYQEYGADEKVQLPRSVGMLNPELYGALSGWNMADVYGPNAKLGTSTAIPQLNSAFLIETPDNLARDLVIEDMDLSPQFIGDFIIHGTNRKVMPVYNIPGVGGVL